MLDSTAVRNWDTLADDATIERTVAALHANHIEVFVVDTKAEAKQRALELMPDGAEVFTVTSATVQAIDLADEINESARYDSIRKKLHAMDRATQGHEMRRLGSAPEYSIGSVHGLTVESHCMI